MNGTNGTLPTLTGSEKQIAWAEKLREKAINEMKSDIARKERMVELADSDSSKLMWKRLLSSAVEIYNDLISCTSASKIISDWR